METSLHVSVGTYEHLLYGFTCSLAQPDVSNQLSTKLTKSFIFEPHGSPISCVSSFGPHLVSGSKDELMKIFNLRKMVEVGTLMLHEGTITEMAFFGKSHMISGSEDGSLCIWSTKDWDNLKTLTGHKGAVISLSVHPTGMLALSLSRDGTMRLWNLTKGQCEFVTKQPNGRIVRWSLTGHIYAVAAQRNITCYDVNNGKVISTIECSFQPQCMEFVTDDILVIGGLNPNIYMYQVKSGEQLLETEAHSTRVKCLVVKTLMLDSFEEDSSQDTQSQVKVLFSCGSTGEIKVWQLNMEPNLEIQELASADIGCRVTSLSVSDVDHDQELFKEQQQHAADAAKKLRQDTTKAESIKPKTRQKRKKGADGDGDAIQRFKANAKKKLKKKGTKARPKEKSDQGFEEVPQSKS